ncbi:MAG: hypothetical protein HYS17_09430 [Micavibrio aeruginosavorus]|uniref:Uncharacterized protein n=1 Tax=Micavibrio aeruginosavorus TaxID=349221 RepID=A0A7T5UG04_9BACT|nr:MAG: hypothetical protein HYS17_09430 [Micavibrio aeruginosavorus]
MAQDHKRGSNSGLRTLFNSLVTVGGYFAGLATIGGPAGAVAAHDAKNHVCHSLHLRCGG